MYVRCTSLPNLIILISMRILEKLKYLNTLVTRIIHWLLFVIIYSREFANVVLPFWCLTPCHAANTIRLTIINKTNKFLSCSSIWFDWVTLNWYRGLAWIYWLPPDKRFEPAYPTVKMAWCSPLINVVINL